MAVKKPGKSALDYDPLSWLKGEESAPDKTIDVGGQAASDSKSTQTAETGNAKTVIPEVDVVEPAVEAVVSETKEQAVTAEPEPVDATVEANAPPTAVNDMQASATEYLHLDHELTMRNVAEFKAQLEQMLQQDTPIAIDADELRKIDSAGLQLLFGLQQTLAKNGTAISWKQPSEVISAAAAVLSMDFDDAPAQQDTAEIEAEQGWGFF